MSGDVLANIDAAIYDFEVSPDAMRMRPEGFTAEEQPTWTFDPRAIIEITTAFSTGPGRHGAMKHARDMRRAYLKQRARRP